MLLCRHLIPENIKLRANSNILPNLVNFVNTFVIDDNFQILGVVRVNNACQNIDQCGFPSPIMPKNAHKLIGLDFETKIPNGLDSILGAHTRESFRKIFDSKSKCRDICPRITVHSFPLLYGRLLLVLDCEIAVVLLCVEGD